MHTVSRNLGFTFIEVMAVCIIMALIVVIALPTYRSQVVKSRRTDCMATMMTFAQAMDKHYALNFTYEGAADKGKDIGAPADNLHPPSCPIDGSGQVFYNLSIEAATANSYTLRATPKTSSSQDGNGILEINSLGQRFWDENDDGDTGDSGESNWSKD